MIAIIDSGPLIVGFYLTPYLLEVAKLSPKFTGIVFLIGQLTDGMVEFILLCYGLILILFLTFTAITAPVIGKLSDNTRTRMGRRRPWIILGTTALL